MGVLIKSREIARSVYRNTRICIMSSVHKALDTRVFYKEARTLARSGFRVTLIAQHDKDETVNGVKIVALKKPGNRLLRILLSPPRIFIYCMRKRAHIYHFHDPELVPLGIVLKVLTDARVIYDIHEDVPKQILNKQWIPFFLRAIISGFAYLLENISLYFLDAIFVAGEDIAVHLPSSGKVALLRNFPVLDIIKQKRGIAKKTGGSTVLIYAGTLTRDRGIKEMVKMTELVNGKVELLLVGGFPDPHFETEVRREAKKGVVFTGQVSHKKVFDHLEKASIGLILLHPIANSVAAFSRNNKIFEYMAMGLPIISSNFQCWKKGIEDKGYGITVDPLNPREISQAVEYLMAHPGRARRMGEKGRKAVLEKYNWENEGKTLIATYRKLLN